MENKMIKTAILTLMFVIGIVGIGRNVRAATRIFYEDCEDTTFTEHFLERYYGTGHQSYWLEFTSEVSRSTETPYKGQYCMTYDPWTTGNPHAVVGYAGAIYGNTSGYDLSSYNQRYWYFCWYQRWETGIDWSGSAQNKLLYINYRDAGDFVFVVARNGSSNFHITIKDHDTYSIVVNDWLTNPGGNLDDMQWHKIEVFIDVGTTGQNNGSYLFIVDDDPVNEHTDIQYNGTIHSNPVQHLTGWPSNTSGTITGTCNTWLDDLEIWDGIPEGINEKNIAVFPNPCRVYMGHNSITFNNLSSNNDIIKIYNISGKIIHNSENITSDTYIWNVNNISSGIYFYRITGSNKASGKIVIIR